MNTMNVGTNWGQSIGEGYIWSLSVNRDLMAVLGPASRSVVYILDAGTGEIKKELLDEWSVFSVAVTDDKELLFTGRPQGQNEPGIWICSPEQDEIQPLQFHSIGEIPSYEQEISFGKIALVPDQKQALIAGVSDLYDIRGFLLLADWKNGIDSGQVSLVAKGIDEAPHDITIAGEMAYIATGRGGTIEVFNIAERQFAEPYIATEGIFKPMRVVTTEHFVAAASYDELFWWISAGEPVGHEGLSSSPDCINGLATLGKDIVICALTYSNTLKLKDLQSSTIATSLSVDIEHPCNIITNPAHENDFYVIGHTNGRISALSLNRVLVGAGPTSFRA
jgi:hypothetical protein